MSRLSCCGYSLRTWHYPLKHTYIHYKDAHIQCVCEPKRERGLQLRCPCVVSEMRSGHSLAPSALMHRTHVGSIGELESLRGAKLCSPAGVS